MQISKYVKKVDVVEEKGRVFVHLCENRSNNPNFIKKILSKYNLGNIVYESRDLYVYEIPVKSYKMKQQQKVPEISLSESEPTTPVTPVATTTKRTRRTRRSSRKTTKTTNDS